MTDRRAVMAASNNADWYEIIFAAHGCGFRRVPGGLVAVDSPPALHSWVTISSPEIDTSLLDRIAEMARGEEFVVKDSFCSLDLEALRLEPFIEASWIHCAEPLSVDTSDWQAVETPEELRRWERAWADGELPTVRPFPDALLDRKEVAIWARVRGGVIDAGAIANRSDDCTGLSNVFGDDAAAAAARRCWSFGDGRPVVGYEWGEALDGALTAGFDAVGPLRICRRR